MKLDTGHKPNSLCQKIRSRLDEAELLALRIRELLQMNGLGEQCFPIELLSRECLTNAVIHGNRSDAEKSVVLRMNVGHLWIRLQVTDEGTGFAWRKVYGKTAEATSCSGRGLLFCGLYAERVRFNRSGNQITLWIRKKCRKSEVDQKMAAYVVEQNDQRGSVKFDGDLTAVVVPELQTELKGMLNTGARELVFDLSNTAMLDSTGMGLLIATANSLTPNGGKIRVTNVSPDIFRLLQSMRLITRLNVSARA